MIEIIESESNRTFRQSALFLAYLFIAIGSALLLVQLLFYKIELLSIHDIPFLIISFTIILFGCYLRKRVARVSAIGEDAIELVSSKQKLLLSTNDIVSIVKMVRFALSESAWMIITFMNNKGKRERWLFQTEPNMELTNKLKKMGVRLKNIP